MLLNPYDEQLALDYTIYMMMGSFFDKTKAASTWREKILRLRYQLLPQKTQYEIEEACERYFEKKILPEMPEDFLKGKASVHWVESKNKKYTAVVFVRGRRQLWIASLYGGRILRPVFEHWIVGMETKELPEPTEEADCKQKAKTLKSGRAA